MEIVDGTFVADGDGCDDHAGDDHAENLVMMKESSEWDEMVVIRTRES